ncbi:hypothetical protein [Glaciihabitans sp. dw_435]|uniref:hypothetical protein n=1 Tax=Glaciihabitans sp. dw_435 TaxID=2720081 RepID=UPI001BD2A81E|nr:hypothetical protein [Glaciihabitans sp. dw_435]
MTDTQQYSPADLSRRIGIFQSHDANGTPDVRQFTMPYTPFPMAPLEESVARQIFPLAPRPTEYEGVYYYGHPGIGAGWLRLENFSDDEVARVHRLLVPDASVAPTLALPQATTAAAAATPAARSRGGNPILLVVWGAVAVIVGIATLLTTVSELSVGVGAWRALAWVLTIIISGALVALGAVLVTRGITRLTGSQSSRDRTPARGIHSPDDLGGAGV